MILVAAVLVGLTAGLCRAWIGQREYRFFELRHAYLVLLAFVPQYFAFFAPGLRETLSNELVAILQISSILLLLCFSILNIRKTGFWPIIAGFFLNFLVIVMNGGFMPISPATAQKMVAGTHVAWEIGQRFDFSKDMVLSPETTRLAFLSDRFTLQRFLGFNVAFSLGDVLIALGVVLLLWTLGGNDRQEKKEMVHDQHLC